VMSNKNLLRGVQDYGGMKRTNIIRAIILIRITTIIDSYKSWNSSGGHDYTKLDTFVIETRVSEDPNREEEEELKVTPSSCGLLSCVLGSFCLPFSLFSCFVLGPKEEAVLLNFGSFNGVARDPGCHYVCCMGRTILKTSTKVQSMVLPTSKTIDRDGNPLVVSGVLSYQVRNAKKALLDIENVTSFIRTQSIAALKQIVARYPYEGDEMCLKNNADAIALELVTRLQSRVQIAGLTVLTFTFNEISYATEIASAMLKKQQAQAILSARSAIVRERWILPVAPCMNFQKVEWGSMIRLELSLPPKC
jgi:hypothetical protein